MIEMKNVVKTFDGFTALDGACVSVPDGGVYGLVGPNGAGKSTIIRHLTGIYRPDSGEVLVEGAPVYENPEKKALIAAIPDDWYYFPSATIADMMKFYRGFYPAFDMARYEKFREVFSLPEKTPIRRMSKGMQKQAAFWLTMSCRPRYLVLDEPVDGLDPVMRRQVWSLMMSDVSEYGTTVLVSSHNLRELEDVCDHVGLLSHGKMALERSLSELQRGTVKLQAAFQDSPPKLPADIKVLHADHVGRVWTYIVRGTAEEVEERFRAFDPLFVDALPLTLEEIFIYEMGGEDYAVRDIVL